MGNIDRLRLSFKEPMSMLREPSSNNSIYNFRIGVLFADPIANAKGDVMNHDPISYEHEIRKIMLKTKVAYSGKAGKKSHSRVSRRHSGKSEKFTQGGHQRTAHKLPRSRVSE